MSDNEQNPDQETTDRQWYEVPLWILWALLEIVFLQGAIVSFEELEPRAAILFTGIFLTLLFAAFTIIIIRRNRLL